MLPALKIGPPLALVTPTHQGVTPVTGHTKNDAAILTEIFDIIISVYGGRTGCYAKLARDGEVTIRTAHHWMARSHAPRIPHLFTLMRNNATLRRAILALIAQMPDTP